MEAGLITEAQAQQMAVDFEAMKAGFPEDPWFPILNLDFNSAFTNAPADDDPYNDTGNPVAFNESIVRAAWANDSYGLVVWLTHGLSTLAEQVYDLDNDPLYPPLDDKHPSFVYMDACLNACPREYWHNGYNLAYSILHNGGVGTMAATTTALDGNESRISDFWSFFFISQELSNSDARDATIIHGAAFKTDYNFFVYNPYVDPSVGVYTWDPE